MVQTYYQEHIFPDASATVLSLLGSVSGMVGTVFRSFRISMIDGAQIMTLLSFLTGKIGDRL